MESIAVTEEPHQGCDMLNFGSDVFRIGGRPASPDALRTAG